MILLISLIIVSLAICFNFKYELKSLELGSKVFSGGTTSLGKEEDSFLKCPKCNREVLRTKSVYCKKCNLYF
jgi:hypothetical protein